MSHDREKQDDASMKKDSGAEVDVVPVGPTTLKRQMKDRHIAMISIGGVIGTGLFVGTATALREGGPVGMLLAYMVVGSLCYTVMISLGEMAAFLPIPGGHLTFAERFVDPAWSFAVGWLYCYNWIIILPAEISAASVVINYWNKSVNDAAWITMCLGVVFIINAFGAGAYGEAEFIFCTVKIVTIVGLLILGIVLDLGGGPNHDRIGFRYWKSPGPFVQFDGIASTKGRFLGWSAVMAQAAFSFIGTEVVAIAGAEVKNPRRNIPKAIKRVYVRLLLFYVGGVTIIGLLVPSNDDRLNLNDGTAAASPFVIAISNAGIKALPSVLDHVGGHSLPVPHTWLTCRIRHRTAVAGLSSWFGIGVTYIRFYRGLKAQGIDRMTLPYRAPLQPFAAWYATIGCFIVVLVKVNPSPRRRRCSRPLVPGWRQFSGWFVFLKGRWATDTFVTNYLPMVMFPVLYVGAKWYKHATLVPYAEMDFKSGLQEVLDASYVILRRPAGAALPDASGILSFDEPPVSGNWAKRAWNWLVRRQYYYASNEKY
ncbi:Lysine-specific permease [Trametes pubescens]|uniref:Lysine-specific permease n=1 Tax=Trametes pubescens TaxID=154538 RepID=A0A1M2VY37_TRAPU|nr:Lysine-specific permease [Trametes pubescens]